MPEACFQMKSSTVAAVVLDIHHFSVEDFFPQLQKKIDSAPMFFQGAAIVFDLSEFDSELNGPIPAEQLELLINFCRENGLQPMAFKGADDSLKPTIETMGLASLAASAPRKVELPEQTQKLEVVEPEPVEPVATIEEQPDLLQQPAEAAIEPAAEPETVVETVVEKVVETVTVISHRPSKVVTKPVRSGQQVYAEGADLILMAPVSEGAEVLADGHIHVYGTLRGRALAGVKGDNEARIFCQQLEAELVSVAGQFVLNDKIREECWKKPAQIYLENESIQVEEI